MQIFKYNLELLDPMFYSLEGFSGAYTPPMIHATALNFAALNMLNYEPEAQPYIMSDHNGGRNIPRYSDSRASQAFYFTPGRLPPLKSVDYFPDLTKGEHDRYFQRTAPAEALKISKLYFIPPETVFEGYLLLYYPINLDSLEYIRLGSFRGKAQFDFYELKIIKEKENCYASHLVDPLVSRVKRGVAKNILPYPLIENALVSNAFFCKEAGKDIFVAIPDRAIDFDPQELTEKVKDLKKLLDEINTLESKEACEALMYIVRTSFSMYYFLSGITSEKFLMERLKELDGFEELRSTIRNKEYNLGASEFRHLKEVSEREINECQKKIKGKNKGPSVQDSGNGSSTFIL